MTIVVVTVPHRHHTLFFGIKVTSDIFQKTMTSLLLQSVEEIIGLIENWPREFYGVCFAYRLQRIV